MYAGNQVSAKLLLDGGRKVGFLRADSSFNIYGVTPGTYSLEVVCAEYVFEAVRLDISAREKGLVEARINGRPVPYPLVLQPVTPTKIQYFQIRQPYNPLGALIGNPMILIGLVMVNYSLRISFVVIIFLF